MRMGTMHSVIHRAAVANRKGKDTRIISSMKNSTRGAAAQYKTQKSAVIFLLYTLSSLSKYEGWVGRVRWPASFRESRKRRRYLEV